LLDQLDRACIAVLLNSAEGNRKRQGLQRARFFDDARGSALECAACLDAAVAKGITKSDRIGPGKELLARIVAMLTRLVGRFDPDEFRIREDGINA
jgi:four helix bundle protein